MSDKFVSDALPVFTPICNRCEYHISGLTCAAFETIPDEIIFGKNDHSKPLSTQGNDLVYKRRTQA